MHDTSHVLHNGRYLWVCRYEGADYHVTPPRRVRWNPLRIEIGIRRHPDYAPRWYINRKARWAIRWSNFTWRLYRKRRWERQRSGEV